MDHSVSFRKFGLLDGSGWGQRLSNAACSGKCHIALVLKKARGKGTQACGSPALPRSAWASLTGALVNKGISIQTQQPVLELYLQSQGIFQQARDLVSNAEQSAFCISNRRCALGLHPQFCLCSV